MPLLSLCGSERFWPESNTEGIPEAILQPTHKLLSALYSSVFGLHHVANMVRRDFSHEKDLAFIHCLIIILLTVLISGISKPVRIFQSVHTCRISVKFRAFLLIKVIWIFGVFMCLFLNLLQFALSSVIANVASLTLKEKGLPYLS